MAASKVEVDSTFEKQIIALQKANADRADAILGGNSPSNVVPDKLNGWSGNLFDLAGLNKPFNRDALNQAFIRAVESEDSSGVSGDLVAATTQIDYLGTMERAFRARHTMRRPRAMAHAAGVMFGHGHVNGVLVQTALEYVRSIVAQAKTTNG